MMQVKVKKTNPKEISNLFIDLVDHHSILKIIIVNEVEDNGKEMTLK